MNDNVMALLTERSVLARLAAAIEEQNDLLLEVRDALRVMSGNRDVPAVKRKPGRPATVWTPERIAILKALFPTETPVTEIVRRVAAAKGKGIIKNASLRAMAGKLGLHRPEEMRAQFYTQMLSKAQTNNALMNGSHT